MEQKHKTFLKWFLIVVIILGGLFYFLVLKPLARPIGGQMPKGYCDPFPCGIQISP